ncbi:MAG: hypothetical protein E7615_04140 [Ruminococcaceae bacterium]|nr:hypothetical protein [Oscillospiraceae bacterium]
MKKIFLIALILCCIVFVGCTEETIKEDNKVEVEETVTITEKNHNSYGRNCFLRYNDVEDFVYDLSMNYEDYFEVDYKRDESEYKKLLSEQEQKELFELNYFEEVALEYGDETADFLRGFLNKIKEVGVYYPKGKYLATIYQYDIDYSYEGIKEVYVKDMVKRIDVNRNPYNNIYGYKRILSPTIQYELNDPYCTGCFVEITITYLDESMKNADVETVLKDYLGIEAKYYTKKLKLKDRTVKAARFSEKDDMYMWYVFVYDDVLVGVRGGNIILRDVTWFWKWQFEVIKPETSEE